MGGGLLDLNGYSPTIASLSGTGGTIDNVSAGGTVAIAVSQTGNTTFAGTIANTTGTVSLTKSGAGTLTLSGTGTYNGNTTITGGTITIASSTAVKAGTTVDVQTNTGLLLGTANVSANILLTLPNGTATQMFDVVPGSHATISGNITEAGATGGAQTRFNAGNDPTTTDLTVTGNISTTTGITDLERGSFIFAGNSVFTATGGNGIWFGRNAGSNVAVVAKDNAHINGTSVTLAAGGAATTSATFTLQDNAVVNANAGNFETGGQVTTSTVNLNGGTLQAGGITHTSGTGTINFNGTQIIAGQSNATFFSPALAITANVQAGGAKFDSGGFDIAIAQPLSHDPALVTADGGLTKSGGGTLSLQAANTYNGTTTVNGGTLSLEVAGGSTISSSPQVVLNGGTLGTFGSSQLLSATNLTVSANSTIDMGDSLGANDQVILAPSNSQTWNPSAFLRINNWNGIPVTGNGTVDNLMIFGDGGTLTGLTSAQKAAIHFTGYVTGAKLVTNGSNSEIVPASATQLLIGDVNQDTHVDVADVQAMMTALSDLTAYAAQHPSLDAPSRVDVLDPNHDLHNDNLDVQALINLLANGGGSAPGGGSLTAVPEPGSLVLAILALPALTYALRRRAARQRG